jgi:Protein of unknown function (DUF1800)
MSAPLPADLNRVDPTDAWQPWRPVASQPFNTKWAAHLLRRAAFGASPIEIQSVVRDGLDKTLDRLLDGDPRVAARAAFLSDTGENLAREDDPVPLRGWWLYAMLYSGNPLREKLTLFWHNHFATSVNKVRSPLLMFRQNQALRTHALGKFGPLLWAVSRDPAMLVWLDSNENVKSHPNENFAREVMELFTLGVGSYTEMDIREAARAFTGWHVNATGDGFEQNADEHDDGPKTIFGRSGNWDGNDVLQFLLERPPCARFVAAKLYRFLVSETEPPAVLLESLAEQLRKSQYDIGATVKRVLRSRLFFSEHAFQKRIKSPIEFVFGTVRAAWPGPYAPADLVEPLESMGQSLFAPPNVKGWTGGKNWLTDSTLLARNNFAERVCADPQPPASPSPVVPGYTALSGAVARAAPVLPSAEVAPQKQAPATPPTPAATPGTDSIWYVRKREAKTRADIVRAIGEQFLPGTLPDRAATRLEGFLGKEPITDQRVREAIHAVLCLPEYQLC